MINCILAELYLYPSKISDKVINRIQMDNFGYVPDNDEEDSWAEDDRESDKGIFFQTAIDDNLIDPYRFLIID